MLWRLKVAIGSPINAVLVNRDRWYRLVWPITAVALGLAMLATWHSVRLRADVTRMNTEIAAIELIAAAEPVGASSSGPGDFVSQLPRTASADAFFKQLQRSTTQSGVSLQLVTAKASAATVQTLGRVDLTINLRGAYGPIKEVLAQTVAVRGVVLQRLVLRRQTSPADVEGQAELTMLSQPIRAVGN